MRLNIFCAIIGALISFTVAGLALEAGDILPGSAWLLAGGVWTGTAFDTLFNGRHYQ